MAKEKELKRLMKGISNFTLIGRAKIGEYTFNTNVESQKEDSDWVYNQMSLMVDCGEEYGLIRAELMGGYGAARENKVFVHGVKEENGVKQDDFKNRFEIAWEDRFDDEVLESVGNRCFITIGVEQEKNKTVYKKFLSAYDAVEYLEATLQDDMVINVKGNLKWSIYNKQTQCKKEITSIVLSKAEEKDFKATFTQSVLLTKDSIGKLDKETMSIPIECVIVDYFKDYNGTTVKTMLPIHKVFDLKIDKEKKELSQRILKTFKVTGSNQVDMLSVDGYFTKGEVQTMELSENDIPDDVKELIEMGLVDKDEIMEKMAFANGMGNKTEKMYIKAPHVKFAGETTKTPVIDKETKAYTIDEIDISTILESLGVKDALDAALENEDEDNEDSDDDNWLDELE